MLTDKQIKAFKPEATDKKKTDAQGLYFQVKKNGSKLWQMAYRFNGKQKVLSFGAYPLVYLAEARQVRDDVKREAGR
ncbi:Arm DNA-binding domain-containing protein [Commensalibacter papalotli (ex Botero et al. 2024)]|uniref:Includes phage integrase (FimB) n=1 Tax=Commensalibacter papalotli (ex Botero et al. 2024) TaxID=2972766 RepID=A0ABN8WAC9_9PROT|nr:Arm DNA-binding domain-containing protein [Commensalibacter papalotli (ex Botero et al. 2024)]CAI3932756.1 Integrase/recombinase [Commensalibacter papalotli (ex Botero et al. 2024)]CAI3945937.1 Integrase/recombinase [Commensalibacter papalotli (ex Botero et al. 2024)]